MELMKWAFANFGAAGVALVRLGYNRQQILDAMVVHSS